MLSEMLFEAFLVDFRGGLGLGVVEPKVYRHVDMHCLNEAFVLQILGCHECYVLRSGMM